MAGEEVKAFFFFAQGNSFSNRTRRKFCSVTKTVNYCICNDLTIQMLRCSLTATARRHPSSIAHRWFVAPSIEILITLKRSSQKKSQKKRKRTIEEPASAAASGRPEREPTDTPFTPLTNQLPQASYGLESQSASETLSHVAVRAHAVPDQAQLPGPITPSLSLQDPQQSIEPPSAMEIPPTENELPDLLERDLPESNQLLLVPSFCFSRKGQFPDTAGDFIAFDNDLHSQTTLLFSRMHILDIPVDELDNSWVRPTVQAIRYPACSTALSPSRAPYRLLSSAHVWQTISVALVQV